MDRRIYLIIALGFALALAVVVAAFVAADNATWRPLPPGAVALTGPWRFATGDDPARAAPGYDDSAWETVDLTAPPASRDGDVGLPDYVGGWMGRGHPNHSGFAWYRLRLDHAPAGKRVLLGSAQVDDGYQVYWNGRRIGGSGRLDGRPWLTGTRPLLMDLPDSDGGGVIAIRVYMMPGLDRAEDSGGLHMAPILAGGEVGHRLYGLQWWRAIAGYIVDLVEAVVMLVLAAIAVFRAGSSGNAGFLRFVAAALVATATRRIGQPAFYWSDIVPLDVFNMLLTRVLLPAGLTAWAMTWNRWKDRGSRIVDVAAVMLGVSVVAAEVWGGPGWVSAVRLGFVALFAVIAVRIARQSDGRPLALAAMALMAVGLFAGEVSRLGVPGIWFPLGIGVSRTQYAYALALPLLALLIMRACGSRAQAPQN